MIVIGNKSYEVLKDHRNGWNPEAFRERYSEVLERYDYIVGDWGYNQLRLKGFYRDNHPKAAKDSTFSSMSDYINEYCNFGCAHFVLQKSKEQKEAKERDSKEPAEGPASPKEIRVDGDPKGNMDNKETKEMKETPQDANKVSKDNKNQRERREAKEARREQRDLKESKEKEAKPSKELNPPAEQHQ